LHPYAPSYPFLQLEAIQDTKAVQRERIEKKKTVVKVLYYPLPNSLRERERERERESECK